MNLEPYVKRMRDAGSDAERAAVLLEAPVLTLLRWRGVFDDCCRRAAFDEGRRYLDALVADLGHERHRGVSPGVGLSAATSVLVEITERGDDHG